MNTTTKYYLTCIFLCGICITNAGAQTKETADSLFAAGRYFEASIGYERVIFAAESPERAWYATLQKIQCLKQQGLFAQAESYARANVNSFGTDSLKYRLQYEQVINSFLAGNYETAASTSEVLLLSHPEHAFDRNLVITRILALNQLQQWDKASALAKQYNSELGLHSDLYAVLPKLKSKDKAQWLSTFIPGGGQFYAGKPLEAMVTILIQGAGIYFGVTSFLDHSYLSAWLVGAGLFGSFHMGGVRRSEALVEQYNQRKAAEFNGKIKVELLK